MRIAVVHPQTPFVRGGAETHTESVVRALREAGHDAEEVVVAGKWYPATEVVHQMAVWRSFDISESNGLKVDAVIALKFPAYLAPHERKKLERDVENPVHVVTVHGLGYRFEASLLAES